MKTISKHNLDEVIRLTKKYYETGNKDFLSVREVSRDKLSMEAFGNDLQWCAFTDLVGSIIGGYGLNKNATNADIYRVFEVLGYEIKGTEKE